MDALQDYFDPSYFPYFDSIGIPAFILPVLLAPALMIFGKKKKATYRRRNQVKESLESQPWQSQNAEDEKYNPPNSTMELLRTFACIGPMPFFFYLVGYTVSCLPWRGLMVGPSATPPSFVEGFGVIYGQAFLGAWITMSLWNHEEHKRTRAYRSPFESLKWESSFCARAAGWGMVVWMGIWVALWMGLKCGVFS